MKKITVDAKAFAEAINKVSRVLKKSAIPILEEIAVSVISSIPTFWLTKVMLPNMSMAG